MLACLFLTLLLNTHSGARGYGFFHVLLYLLMIFPLALLLTYGYLKIAERRMKKKSEAIEKDKRKQKKLFKLMKKRNEKFEEQKRRQKEKILKDLNLKANQGN